MHAAILLPIGHDRTWVGTDRRVQIESNANHSRLLFWHRLSIQSYIDSVMWGIQQTNKQTHADRKDKSKVAMADLIQINSNTKIKQKKHKISKL